MYFEKSKFTYRKNKKTMSTSTYIFILILILLIASGLFIVKQQTFAVIERFGHFIALRRPGFT